LCQFLRVYSSLGNSLSDELVGDGLELNGLVELSADDAAGLGLLGDPLKLGLRDLFVVRLSVLLLLLVLLHALQEVQTAVRVLHMLDADVDALGDDAAPEKHITFIYSRNHPQTQ
jgi:hypothetical protein